MEDNILNGTKKMLGLAADYHVFDHDIITYINSAFSSLDQIGVGPELGFEIEDEDAKWSDVGIIQPQLSMVRTYILLKTRMLFDPPTTSYMIAAMEKQIDELTWRISTFREWALDPVDPMIEEVVIDD